VGGREARSRHVTHRSTLPPASQSRVLVLSLRFGHGGRGGAEGGEVRWQRALRDSAPFLISLYEPRLFCVIYEPWQD